MRPRGEAWYLLPMEASLESVGRAARDRLKAGIVRLFVRQAVAEFKVTWRTRLRFREGRNAEALRAYCAMTEAEFDGINARQRWADWRTIPRSLRGRMPARPCRAIDLCSGSGHSAEVLAYCLPPGSEILGLEFNPVFVGYAARRRYPDRRGNPARVSFRVQSVLDVFRGADGRPIPDGSVDLVNSCGALGIHFDAPSLDRIAAEVARVLRPGGLAAIDSGTTGVRADEMTRIFARRGFEARGRAKSCFLDRFTQIAFVKPATGR